MCRIWHHQLYQMKDISIIVSSAAGRGNRGERTEHRHKLTLFKADTQVCVSTGCAGALHIDQWRWWGGNCQAGRERNCISALSSEINVSLSHSSPAFLIKDASNVSWAVFGLLQPRIWPGRNAISSAPCLIISALLSPLVVTLRLRSLLMYVGLWMCLELSQLSGCACVRLFLSVVMSSWAIYDGIYVQTPTHSTFNSFKVSNEALFLIKFIKGDCFASLRCPKPSLHSKLPWQAPPPIIDL